MKELLAFAIEMAENAGKIILQYYQKEIQVDSKPDNSPVTIADRSAEEFLRAEIGKRFPDDAILGEEFGVKDGHSGFRWILDPIDGTKSFVRGVPLFGCMIALERDGKSLLGVVRFPVLGDTIAALSGEGCFLNGNRCRASQTREVSKASIMMQPPNAIMRYQGEKALLRLLRDTGVQYTYADCYGFLLVAAGRADAIYEPKMNIWDTAPLFPIIEEAGGRISSLDGDRALTMKNSLASNGILHEALCEILRNNAE
ncbi:MAG: inositol monophosphatase family protein [Candidatus Omnitrophota bacterium]